MPAPARLLGVPMLIEVAYTCYFTDMNLVWGSRDTVGQSWHVVSTCLKLRNTVTQPRIETKPHLYSNAQTHSNESTQADQADAFLLTIEDLYQRGDVAGLVRGMSTYAAHVGVQGCGCWVLSNLAANADNQIKIAEEGGIKVVMDAMRKHSSHGGVQEQGCWALLNIGWSRKDLHKKIKNEGAHTFVETAMKASNATYKTQDTGHQLLDTLGGV